MMDERLTVFIDSLYSGNPEFLDCLEEKALSEGIPIIKKGTQAFLKYILLSENARSILEIGTATGFSAIFMAYYSRDDAVITTIENYEKRIPEAKKNISASGLSDKIKLIEGDAEIVLPDIKGSFDLIFIDAAKAQYPFYLKEAKRLVSPGGVIVADNCLKGGDILESRYAIERRDRTIHKRMREFLKELTSDAAFASLVLPIGDGVAVAKNLLYEGI